MGHQASNLRNLVSCFGDQDIGTIDLSFSLDFSTNKLQEAQAYLRSHDESVSLEISHPDIFNGYSASVVKPGNIAFSRTRIGSSEGYALFFRPREYSVNIPLKGSGWAVNGSQVIKFTHKQALFLAPQCDIVKHWQSASEVITIHIPEQYLHSHAELSLPDNLAPISLIERSAMTDVIELIHLLCKAGTDRHSPLACPSVIEHLEKATMIALLRCLPGGNEAPRARSPAVPYYVRRADHYMRANFRPGVTMLDIAKAVGVSERTLQYGFRNSYDMSPLQFFKRLRLNHSRSLLMANVARRTLSEIAWELGYQTASHFASDYRALFGEYPSQTLARSKSTPVSQSPDEAMHPVPQANDRLPHRAR